MSWSNAAAQGQSIRSSADWRRSRGTIQVLCRRKKNNPLYVGEPGVGKTALAEGLALKISEGNVPDVLKDAKVFALDMGAVLAGTRYRGDFEQRFKSIVSELKKHPNAILFIDEIHTIVGAGSVQGGSMDASNILKPALAAGELRCIGSTTYSEYKAAFERDRALARRFQKIEIGEPTIDETYQILKGLKKFYEQHHGVRYTNEALKTAAELAGKYINDRFLPDKAIDVIDEVGASVKLMPANKRPKKVSVQMVENTVARMAKIPPKSVVADEKARLKTLREDIKKVIYGQDDAIDKIVDAIQISRAGLGHETKPVGFILVFGSDRRRKDRGIKTASRDPGHRVYPVRYERVRRAAHRLAAYRRTAGICRLRPGWFAHRGDHAYAACGACARRN